MSAADKSKKADIADTREQPTVPDAATKKGPRG